MRILLIEDDEYIIRALMARFSLKKGWKVSFAFNGIDALDRMKRKEHDLVLLDIILPGMNGLDVLHEARKEGVETDVFVVTNLSGIEHKAKANILGVKEYFEKASLDLKDLIHKMEAYA